MPVVPAYLVWAYYVHGWQRRCQEDLVSLPSGGLEKTTRSSPHHVAQHRPTGSEATPPYAPRSSRFGSESPSVEDDVDVWHYAILELHTKNDDANDDGTCSLCLLLYYGQFVLRQVFFLFFEGVLGTCSISLSASDLLRLPPASPAALCNQRFH